MKENKTFQNNNQYKVTKNNKCNGIRCQETYRIIVEEPLGKFDTIKLFLCYSCAKKFQKLILMLPQKINLNNLSKMIYQVLLR